MTNIAEINTREEIARSLHVLMNGTRQEFKSAKKEIEKLWHSQTKAFKKNADVALEYLSKFDQIEKIENQAAFASGLSLFFLALGDEHFDVLKNFTLKVLQHPSGTVREAIRKTADWLYYSLTSRAEPFVYPAGKALTEGQQIEQAQARTQYINLVKEIEILIDKYDDENEDVEYIDEMKPSVNKSLQMFWSRLKEGRMYRRIIEQEHPVPLEIFVKRNEIEKELLGFLKETGSDFDLEDIKDIIYNEDGQDALTDIIAMFDTGQGAIELQNIMETISDAWNYFPHKSLNGLSPKEKLLEYNKSHENQN